MILCDINIRDMIRPSMQLVAGFRLGSYEIIAPLGAGGMGEVYRARDAALKRDVAIKTLLSTHSLRQCLCYLVLTTAATQTGITIRKGSPLNRDVNVTGRSANIRFRTI